MNALTHSVGTLFVFGFFAVIGYLLIAAIARRVGPKGPDLATRLAHAFDGKPQVLWQLRGGGIAPERLIAEANRRGYAYIGESSGAAAFNRR